MSTRQEKADARKAAAILEGQAVVGDVLEIREPVEVIAHVNGKAEPHALADAALEVIKVGPKYVTMELEDTNGEQLRLTRENYQKMAERATKRR